MDDESVINLTLLLHLMGAEMEDEKVIELANKAGVFAAYHEQNLSEFRNALIQLAEFLIAHNEQDD